MESDFEMLTKEYPVRLAVNVLPAINYALQRGGAAPIRSVSITNETDAPLENLEIEIRTAPEFILPFTRHIDCIPAHKTVEILHPKVVLNSAFLSEITEKISGFLTVKAVGKDGELASVQAETSVLAFDQWHGLGLYPELLASFITPNHPAVAGILSRAAKFLGQWTGDTSLDAYQSQDPHRVVSQAAAIFNAIKERGIAYVVHPASFEETGQRIRLCDEVLSQKLGTCLDLTLLYCACLEAAGLHPLMVIREGHIFSGIWLEEKMFPESVQDDGSLITKRLAAGVNEIAVVETTLVTTGTDASFDDARIVAEQSFIKYPTEYIIDVRRARLSGVLPLPHRVGGRIVEDPAFCQDVALAPKIYKDTIQIDPNAEEDTIPRKQQWERKLLDLGMRNTLINLRLTKTQLPILTNSLDELEDALAGGSDFSIAPRPTDLAVGELTFEHIHELGGTRLIQAEFQNKRLRSVYTEAELSKTIKNLYRTAKTSLEENGANTLYLALGMLRWFESKRSTKPRYAPIILLPIEMVRKSAAQGYVIRLRDEEPQMNITLLEKLKQDFGIIIKGLDPLPTDDQGIDIRKVLTIVRQAIMGQTHWDVVEMAAIGIFSFSQFVMWNDIRNRTDDLLRNKVVNSLMEGRLTWSAQPLEIGRRVDENDVLLPMAADASQLHAIRTACAGKSFVLHGPPGTGKSQTITSLIANALAQGKSVLFVAEKMAALEVVQRRLTNIGIGPFCLELHSNKSKKKDVLEQLRRASEVTKQTTAEAFDHKAEQIAAQRAELDVYAHQLHQTCPCGSTLYQLINRYETHSGALEIEPFSREYVRSIDQQDAEDLDILVERLVSAGRETGHPHDHPLERIRCTRYTQTIRTCLPGVLDEYDQAIRDFSDNAKALAEMPIRSVADLKELSETARELAFWHSVPGSWSKAEFPGKFFEDLTAMAGHFRGANELREKLLEDFNPEFLNMNGQQLLADFQESSAKWFLPKMIGTNKVAGQVKNCAKNPINKENLEAQLTMLRDYQTQKSCADELLTRYGRELGNLYDGDATDWRFIEEKAAEAGDHSRALWNRFGSNDFLHTRCGRQEDRTLVQQFCRGYEAFETARQKLNDLLDPADVESEDWLDAQLALAHAIREHQDHLKEWITYTAIEQEAAEAGLANVTACYRAGADHEMVYPAYQKALLFALICDAIDVSPSLNAFSGAVFNEKIEQYKRADREWMALSQQEVYCRLAAKVPNFTREAAQSSELGILQRCIKSGGRGTSIRKLFDQIPNLLPRLCPCMLMSPISAAQYLDPKREPFDIVIFDEASQLPTCKAVGVLARGRNAVIVGDPKQMPPTAFFATNTVDEDNLDMEDLESILDDCLALNMPQTHLLWHYRSRHESLIAFSNSRFYENKLYTFPSVNDRESKVRLVPVEGVFERGKSRKNRAEAEAVIAELKRRCYDPVLSKQSIGVVTFNISQQNLIDDMLNEACAKDAVLEKWAYGSEEPLFIKNLENVQGDERDVILFSIGYGPDENGKVYMNFGPLNRDGGWRRLNVAVSRARCEMVVFSTLRPDQIDLNRTHAEGVAALRAFLEYAEGRTLALSEHSVHFARRGEDGVARAIADALRARGFETDLQVGRSQYRIDIGVIDPRDPDRYILGIMLDGPGYGGAKTTRDREIAQISVLTGLGWEITRVWSMDWWDNRRKELKRLLALLDKLQQGKTETPIREEIVEAPTESVAAAPALVPRLYSPAELPAESIPAEWFTESQYERRLREKIRAVIDGEAPVSAGMLTRRVVQSCGIARAGSRIQAHLDAVLLSMNLRTTRQEGVTFYWRGDQDPESYCTFRTSGEGERKRDVRDVCVQEAANAVCTVLLEQISMTREDLIRETARKLGYTRLGGNVTAAMDAGLAHAGQMGSIALNPGGMYLLTESGTDRANQIIETFRA